MIPTSKEPSLLLYHNVVLHCIRCDRSGFDQYLSTTTSATNAVEDGEFVVMESVCLIESLFSAAKLVRLHSY